MMTRLLIISCLCVITGCNTPLGGGSTNVKPAVTELRREIIREIPERTEENKVRIRVYPGSVQPDKTLKINAGDISNTNQEITDDTQAR